MLFEMLCVILENPADGSVLVVKFRSLIPLVFLNRIESRNCNSVRLIVFIPHGFGRVFETYYTRYDDGRQREDEFRQVAEAFPLTRAFNKTRNEFWIP